ncbi:MAG TPA: hypothetical protein EYP17_06620 [Candidatus Latescibacteria bacterium]|nr:hypothetical protein [Candidatus Latescibacterota bacterium]
MSLNSDLGAYESLSYLRYIHLGFLFRSPFLGVFAPVKGYLDLFLLRRTRVVLYSILITGILYFNKFFIGYMVARAMGLKVAFWPTILVQVLVIS